MVEAAVAKREEQLRTAFKTDTLEGRVGELTKAVDKLGVVVDDNHRKTWAKLDETNHVKELFNQRFDKTDAKIDAASAAAQTLMASHLGSPAHTLVTDHLTRVSSIENTLLNIPPKEFSVLPEMVHREAIHEENKRTKGIFAQTLELRVTSLYGILGATSIVASGLIWLATHINLH